MAEAAEAAGTESALVDVIIPTRNRLDFTLEAIRSVRDQSFQNWHLYVVDDASDDGSVDALADALASEPRATLVRRAERGGSNAARQAGLEAGTAEWVGLLDSDDVWEPSKLERQLDVADNHDIVWCNRVYETIGETAKQGIGSSLKQRIGPTNPFFTYNTSTPLIRRTTLVSTGGFAPQDAPFLPTADFMELFLRVTQGARQVLVPEVLVRCRTHSGHRNSSFLGTYSAAEESAWLLSHFDDPLRERPHDRAWLWADTGARLLMVGEWGQGLPILGKAMFRSPTTAPVIVAYYAPYVARRTLGGVRSRIRRRRLQHWRAGLMASATDITADVAEKSCVVFAPHPDDETLGCGALIARKRRAGANVVVVIATDGGLSPRGKAQEVAAMRFEEARRACAALGVESNDVVFLGMEDGGLIKQVDALTAAVSAVIERAQPDEVLVSSVDSHLDHQALNAAVRAAVAGRNNCRVLEYLIWEWMEGATSPAQRKTVAVETGEFLAAKRRALELYSDEIAALVGETTPGRRTELFTSRFLNRREIFYA
jgi:LmbE family N-acetylglucosaminyl deacetylase